MDGHRSRSKAFNAQLFLSLCFLNYDNATQQIIKISANLFDIKIKQAMDPPVFLLSRLHLGGLEGSARLP